MYIRIAFSIELRLRVSRPLRSLANKVSFLTVVHSSKLSLSLTSPRKDMGLRLCITRRKSSQKCVTSKAVLLILIWCFSVSWVFNSYLVGIAFSFVFSLEDNELYYLCMYAANAAIYCIYPLAGFLADNRIGRFITIYEATKFLVLLIILEGITFLTNLLVQIAYASVLVQFFDIFVSVIFLIVLLTIITLALFNANIMQFGVDQLQDSPADHQSLYIYWYVWVNYVAVFIVLTGIAINTATVVAEKFYIYDTFVLAGPLLSGIILLSTVLVVRCKKHWLIIDSARSNPYKLVYRVTKFAHQHKVPIHRSAFTYCEDAIPTGLDLGKNKYGRPFTTEQVEDVKAFYGILKIVLSLGFIFFLDIASGPLFTMFAHIQYNSYS